MISSTLERKAMRQEVQIPVGSARLTGQLTLPSEVIGCVLFAHGSGSSRLSPRNQYVARVLSNNGMATLLFDLLTGDEGREDQRSAAYRFDMGLLTHRLIGATEWVRQQPATQALSLGYFGASTGAAAALRAAAEKGNRIHAVVSRGGRPDLAGPVLKQVHCPTLLIVGALDTEVVALNQSAFARLDCLKELKLIPGATHLFDEPGTLDHVASLASGWFRRHLLDVLNTEENGNSTWPNP